MELVLLAFLFPIMLLALLILWIVNKVRSSQWWQDTPSDKRWNPFDHTP